jgi:hypothetical protein
MSKARGRRALAAAGVIVAVTAAGAWSGCGGDDAQDASQTAQDQVQQTADEVRENSQDLFDKIQEQTDTKADDSPSTTTTTTDSGGSDY